MDLTEAQPRLRWRCSICKVLLALRPTSETEDTFRARCADHERGSNVCRAKVLIKQLYTEHFVPLRTECGTDFTLNYHALKDAGLTTRHLTHVINDTWVRSTPWGPRWAVRYDNYLIRTQRCITLQQRIEALREASTNPGGGDGVEAFLVLANAGLAAEGRP